MSLVPRSSRGELVIRRVNETSVVVYNPVGNQVAIVDSPKVKPNRCSKCGQKMVSEAHSDYFFILEEYNRSSRAPSEAPSESPSRTSSRPHTPFGAREDTDDIFTSSVSQGYFDRFFRTLGLLGRGSRAAVYHVEHVLEGVSIGTYACKKIPVGFNHGWLEKVLSEVNLLRTLHHPNLVRYNHVWLEITALSDFGPPVPCAYLLQEFCDGGTLEDYVLSKKRLSAAQIRSHIADIAAGLEHLHDQGLVHCDLKPSNCLLKHRDGKLTVLVSDFGESQLEGANRSGTGSTGTLEYCAPEVLEHDDGSYSQFTRTSDMYSLGMTLYFLCFGGLPFSNEWANNQDVKLLVNEARNFTFDFAKANAKTCRKDIDHFKPLLESLLGPAEVRPTARQVSIGLNKQPRLLNHNYLRVLKLASGYLLSGWSLHACVVFGAIELLVGYSKELFAVHCAILLASLVSEYYYRGS